MNFDDPPNDGFFVSSTSALIDIEWTIATLQNTYWGQHRTRHQIAESLRHSLCFGLFEHVVRDGASLQPADRQIGFGRVVTDYATFSELVDVVIDPAYRKRGLGKFLVRTIVRDPRISKTVINLGTRDAHTFYESLGFKRVEKMKLIPA